MSPIAVLISDVHYNVHTLKLADASMRMAIDKANILGVPLIVAGDLHDTKANLRGECITAMIETFKKCHKVPFIMVGNHDRINEKAPAHSLEFLRAYANIIDESSRNVIPYLTLIPYYHDPEELKAYLKTLPKKSTLIMHQGIEESNSGDYLQDKSAISKQSVAGFRVVSGHYHRRQTITLPDGGVWDYIGNPYTLNFGEANEPEKGFQVLMDDGTLEFVPTNLRKHVILEFPSTIVLTPETNCYVEEGGNLIWFKIKGPKEDLYRINRRVITNWAQMLGPFKLDLISIDTTTSTISTPSLTQGPLLDSLIDSLTNTSDERKVRLKEIWKSLCE